MEIFGTLVASFEDPATSSGKLVMTSGGPTTLVLNSERACLRKALRQAWPGPARITFQLILQKQILQQNIYNSTLYTYFWKSHGLRITGGSSLKHGALTTLSGWPSLGLSCICD